MKTGLMLAALALLVMAAVGVFWSRKTFSAEMTRPAGDEGASLYALRVNTLAGETRDLKEYQGQVALVVNTASKCGLTPQYEGLEALYKELAGRGFVILGFPSNDFMNQEPGTSAEIAEFCRANFGVTFPLFAKDHVKGDGKSPVYELLTAQLEEPTWNFTKYLVDKQGHVVARFGPRTTPDDAQLRAAIEEQLAR